MSDVHVIVGAGQAGGWAAVTMRREGFQGRILLIGDEPHPPYERPPLSKAVLTAAEDLPIQPFHTPTLYEEHGIELRLATKVTAVDPAGHRLSLADGASLAYDRLLLATGGRARRLAVPGGECAAAIRTHTDALRLRAAFARSRRVVCVGAGVIGLECASSARSLGCDVVVVEPAARPMVRALPEAPALVLRALHERAGVAFRFGTGVAAIERAEQGFTVVCSDGARLDGARLDGDCVIAGIGMERHTELAVAAGLAVEGGIIVDEFGRTSAPDIFAAGDVAAFWHPGRGRRLLLETWQHAQNHGIAVGRAMAGKGQPYDETPWFWSDQHGVNIQVAGFPGDGVQTVSRRRVPGGHAIFYLDAARHLVGAVGFDSPREVRGAQSLIQRQAEIDLDRLADPATPVHRAVAADMAA
jgi:3-phenylpropionate/trans-cinnamate dioxygenase ferredoxin reductase subunit